MITALRAISPISSVELLQSSPHFSEINADTLEKIDGLIVERRVGKDEILWLDGEPGKVLYFVAYGLIKLFKTSAEGKDQIIKVVGPRESFGESALFDISGNSVSAQAMVPSILYGIEKDKLKTLVSEHPQLALNMAKVLAKQMRDYLGLVEDLSFKRVTSRLASILLEYNNEAMAHNSTTFTRQEMAAMAGTVREVIGRSLKDLEMEGIIRLNRQQIVITDSDALREISDRRLSGSIH